MCERKQGESACLILGIVECGGKEETVCKVPFGRAVLILYYPRCFTEATGHFTLTLHKGVCII